MFHARATLPRKFLAAAVYDIGDGWCGYWRSGLWRRPTVPLPSTT